MTTRQIRIFYREAMRKGRRDRAAQIVDVNAGMAGGKHAEKLVDQLTG